MKYSSRSAFGKLIERCRVCCPGSPLEVLLIVPTASFAGTASCSLPTLGGGRYADGLSLSTVLHHAYAPSPHQQATAVYCSLVKPVQWG